MTEVVDSYRFLGAVTKQLVKSWIRLEQLRHIPWTALSRPVTECTIALISTGGIALKTDRPFDQQGERENPWWGDPSFRIIPNTAKTEDIRVYHMHIDPSLAEQDMNCLLPIDRLNELAAEGRIGQAAPSHYSFMGYILKPDELLDRSIPEIINMLRKNSVDLVILIPAWPTCCWSVGLAQRRIEEAGISTVALSNIPDLTAAIGVPRLVGIENPFGQIMGRPGDSAGQRAVLLGTLDAVENMRNPGSIIHLPFKWRGSINEIRAHVPEPPIAGYLKKHPWHLPKLFSRNIP